MTYARVPEKLKVGSVQGQEAAQAVRRALEEDPTVFQYDEVYDEMQERRVDRRLLMATGRQPKYIAALKAQAERRQREYERHTGKLVQKKRAQEADKFRDKDAFVTSAYKKKMEELQRFEEEERRQDAMDDMSDVTKQEDLSGFYRHLYRSTVVDQPKKLSRGDRDSRSGSRDRERRHSRRDTERSRDRRKSRDDKRHRDGEDGHGARRHDRQDRKSHSKSGSSAKVGKRPGTSSSKSGKLEEPRPSVKLSDHPIWKKRTLEQVFEATRERYLERKRNGIVGPIIGK